MQNELDHVFQAVRSISTAWYMVGREKAEPHCFSRDVMAAYVWEPRCREVWKQGPLPPETSAGLLALYKEMQRYCTSICSLRAARLHELLADYEKRVEAKGKSHPSLRTARSARYYRMRIGSITHNLLDPLERTVDFTSAIQSASFTRLDEALKTLEKELDLVSHEISSALERYEKLSGDRSRLRLAAAAVVFSGVYFALGSWDNSSRNAKVLWEHFEARIAAIRDSIR